MGSLNVRKFGSISVLMVSDLLAASIYCTDPTATFLD